ncbi:MAG: beta-ketoacyl-[acyl-carrier-protein] synthase family protein [Desulfobacterales bacterium]|nr:MAG: beta-ketoacyl-[acyl-carrier-protein] synthase family protein [Desulfobacterales bacterium]
MSDIVITGIGVISPMGVGREAFWDSCRKARSGIQKIVNFETRSFRSNIAGWVENFNAKDYMPARVYRRMSRVSRMAVAASIEALEDSKLALDTIDKDRVGVIIGTAYGSSSHVEDFFVSLLKDGPRGAQPFLFPETVPNAPASHISMVHGITGPNTTFCQNDISAENAILYAVNLLSQDIVDVVLVGGADELTAMQYGCYDALGVLNKIKAENDVPVTPVSGGGLVLGEGAGILIMEKSDTAKNRQAPIYGTLKAGVNTGGTTSIGRYEVEGAQTFRAISLAIEHAGINRNETEKQIDIIDVSANFSSELDRMEYDQLKKIFPKHIDNLMVTPLKYLMGNFGGAGAIRVAAVLLSLRRQLPLPSINVCTLKGEPPYGTLNWHIPPARKLQTALMTSSTFGGGNCSLVFTCPPAGSNKK